MFCFTFVNATNLPTAEQGENITLIQQCPTCTYVNISSITYPDNTVVYLNTEMQQNGSTFSYLFTDTSQIGNYIYFVEGDKDGLVQGEALYFEINYSGKDLYMSQSIIYILLSGLLVFLSFSYLYATSKINFDAWNSSIQRKYEGRNYIKATLASIGFAFAKESFMTVYLLMLPVVMMVRDLTILANMDSVITIINTFSIIYSVGMLVIIVLFFGKIQEIISTIINKVKNEKWGIME